MQGITLDDVFVTANTILSGNTTRIVSPLVPGVTAQKWSFPLTISSVNMTKSAENCEFGHITEEIPDGKFHFWLSVSTKRSSMFKGVTKL